MGCAPAAGLMFCTKTAQFILFATFDDVLVLRAPPVPAFYDYVKSVGGGAVQLRPFSDLKRALLLYDDDTMLDFEQVPISLLQHRHRLVSLQHHSII